MHAYLIIGKEQDKAAEFAKKLSTTFGKSFYEFSVSKIDDVREINKFIRLSFSETTTLILKDIENATEEAMNVLLKNLEEPQKNVRFIILTTSINKIIPTIVSRCQIIKATSNKQQVTSNKETQNFINMAIGEKFTYFDKIKKREEAISFIKDLIYFLHNSLVQGKENLKDLARKLDLAQATLAALSANGNVALQLTNFSVQLTQSSGLPEAKI